MKIPPFRNGRFTRFLIDVIQGREMNQKALETPDAIVSNVVAARAASSTPNQNSASLSFIAFDKSIDIDAVNGTSIRYRSQGFKCI